MATECFDSYPIWPFTERVYLFVPEAFINVHSDFPPQRFEDHEWMQDRAAWLGDPSRQGRWGWNWARYDGPRKIANRICFFFDEPHTAFEFKLRYG